MSRFNYTFEDVKTLFRNECCKECKKKYSQRCINCEQIKQENKLTHKGRKKMPFLTEPTEAECFEAEQELLFDVRFRQMDREIRKMMEADKLKCVKKTEHIGGEDENTSCL